MQRRKHLLAGAGIIALTAGLWFAQAALERVAQAQAAAGASSALNYQVDPAWPKALPNNWILGQVPGIAVDPRDHIWVTHRQGSLSNDEKGAAMKPPLSECCVPAPPIVEFDADGTMVRAWGGPGAGYEWPASEHGLFVDHKNNVWLTGENVALKFSSDGKFLLQIGKAKETGGSNDTKLLGRPADVTVDPQANEVYLADGYGNRRVVVFDADTGAYKRHWGAYGSRPDDTDAGAYNPDAPLLKQFRNPVHCVRIANDGLVYACDRTNNRIQVFQKNGTFVKEIVIAKNTLGSGATWDLDFSRDNRQQFLFSADGGNQKVWTVLRDELRIVSSFGRSGRNAGQFHWVHNLSLDSKGNVYTAEVSDGKRVQKFVARAATTSSR